LWLDFVEEISCSPHIGRDLVERESRLGLGLGASVSYEQIALMWVLAIPLGYLLVKVKIQAITKAAVHVFGDVELCNGNRKPP
jgi:hypothetical protein